MSMKKALCLLLIGLIGLGFTGWPAARSAKAEANLSDSIKFRDPLFEKKTRTYLNKPDGPITVKEALGIGELNLGNGGETIPEEDKLSGISDVSLFPNLFAFSVYNNAITDLSPLKKLTGLKFLDLNGNPLSSLKPLASLSELQELRVRSCGLKDLTPLKGLKSLHLLDAADNAFKDVGALKELAALNFIDLSNSQIRDASPLAGMANLKTLRLAGNPVGDFSVLSAIYPNLTESDFTPEQPGADFVIPFDDAALEKKVRAAIGKKKGQITYGDVAPVTELNIGYDDSKSKDVKIQSIEALKYFINLFKLDAWNNEISNLSPLAGLKNLSFLNMDGNPAGDLTPLSGLNSLKIVQLPRATDLTPLKSLASLEGLIARGIQISDISALAGLENLRELDLSYNNISDLSPLSGLKRLTSLKLNGNPVTDYEPIRGILKNLTGKDFEPLFADGVPDEPIEIAEPAFEAALRRAMGIQDRPITQRDAYLVRSLGLYNEKTEESLFSDISPLKWFVNLEELEFNANPITDLSPLSGLNKLRKLNAGYCQVSDLTPLSGLKSLESLNLRFCPVTDITPLKELTNLRWLDLTETQVEDFKPLDGIRKNLELIR
jgi:internalin A